MALTRDLSQAQLAFQVTGGAPDQFLVIRYRGTEGLCQLYRFEIDLAADADALAFDDIVGQAAVLSIATPAGERWFHGIVSRFEMTGETADQLYFRVELVPAVWLLTHRYNSRIFQDKTVPEIITDVLTKGGIASDRFRMVLEQDYSAREYCVQYRETDYNFICRLMEEEGIWWHFEQTQNAHALVMADATSAYQAIEGEAALPYSAPTGFNVPDEHVFKFRLGQSVRPGAVTLNDFNFKNPKLNLEATSDAGRNSELEFADYPGEYAEQSVGQQLARVRAEEFEASRTRGLGQSNSYRLSPGRTFELSEHPSEPANRAYLVTTVTHEGKQGTERASTGVFGHSSLLSPRAQQAITAARQNENENIRQLAEGLLEIASRFEAGDQTANRELTRWVYHAGQVSKDLASIANGAGNSPFDQLSIANLIDDVTGNSIVNFDSPVYVCKFECIPSEVAYRPARVTPWPQMRGSQTARVVGPSGEEIYTDEYGRVKVQFNWDREGKFDESSSCWIRVSQAAAGGQYGFMFLPRVGQEVIVDFLEGNPDQPIITGRVYNADQMPPYKLPDEKTKSVIKTHSSKGGGGTNELRFEDLKDSEQILLYAQKDLHVRVNNDRVENVDNDRHLTVKKNKFELVKEGKNNEVKLDFKEKVGGDESHAVGGKLSEKVGGSYSLQVSGDVVEKFGRSHKHETTMTYAAKALSIKLEASTGIELKCGGSSIVLTPAAIFITGGPLVNINSGSGPPVAPVTAQASSPTSPKSPVDADSVQPGKDTSYSGGSTIPDGATPADVAGRSIDSEEGDAATETSWIEIELVGEDGTPIAGERFEVKAPDGNTIRRGTTDAEGKGRVSVPEPGNCQITFPDLDQRAWERG